MTSPHLVRSEDLRNALEELVEAARQVGNNAERHAIQHGAQALRQARTSAQVEESMVDALQELMEAEIVVAKPAAGEAVIERSEQDREIAKRALMRIRAPQVRAIAQDLGGRSGEKLEESLERIVRAYRGDEEEIAKLVVQYEAEPPPERRFTTRIFHVSEVPDSLETVAKRAELFAHRYIRTGVARWFVIDEISSTGHLLIMRGIFRSFQADAEKEDDTYHLIASASDARASLRVNAGQASVEVDARGATESRAIMAAFQQTGGLRWRSTPPLPSLTSDLARAWDPRSVFAVDLLNTTFRSDAIDIVDLTTAGFESGERTTSDEEDDGRPTVRAVKLDGRHLLDSRQACDLLVAGQGLVELGVLVRFRASADEDFLVPIRLKQERDHTVVLTSFGTVEPQIAHRLHMVVLHGIRQEFRLGIADPAGLERSARTARETAETDSAL